MDKQIFEPINGYEDVDVKLFDINLPTHLNFQFTVLQGSQGTNVLKMVCKCNDRGGMSLTNGMYYALKHIIEDLKFPVHKIMYRDSDNIWGEVLWDGRDGMYRPFSKFAMYDEVMALRELESGVVH